VNIGCTMNKSAALTRIAPANVASRGNCRRGVFSANSRAGSLRGHVLPLSANLNSICCTDPLAKPNLVKAHSYIWPAQHGKRCQGAPNSLRYT
jgi:hypothetical protein